MAFADREVLIRRDAMTVYTFLIDGMNLPRWRNGIRSIGLVSGAAGTKGALYRQTVTGRAGRTIRADLEITEARPGAEIQFRLVIGTRQTSGGYYLSTETAGTRVRFALEYQPKGLLGLMDTSIQRTIRSEVAQLVRLKDVLELGSAA